jgi:hypothetical protein
MGVKACKGAEVGGRFHQHAAAFVDQHLGHQVQALLAAGGDQHLGRVHSQGSCAATASRSGRIAFAGGVLQRGLAVFAQHLGAGLGELDTGNVLGEGRPPAKLMMPGFSVTLRISRMTDGFIFAARRARVHGWWPGR